MCDVAIDGSSSSSVTGFFVLSIDTENPIEPASGLARWSPRSQTISVTREATSRFMRLLDGHAMSATWVVGESAVLEAWGERRFDGYPDRPEHLLDALGGMANRQEIALSPLEFSESRLDRCVGFAEANGTQLRTLALTLDQPADPDRYAALGFTACRWTPPPTRPNPLTDDLFQRPIPTWRPSDLKCAGSLLDIPASINLVNIDSRRRLVPEAVRITRFRKGLERAVHDDALIHLAFCLADLERSESLFCTIEDMLFHIAAARADTGLKVMTIAEIRHAFDTLKETERAEQAA